MILTTWFYDKNGNINEKGLFPKFQLIPMFRLQVMQLFSLIKGIVCDSYNMFYDKNGYINEKRLFPKFQLNPMFRLQVIHDYVH